MDKQNVVDTHNEIFFSLKRKEILIHATTWLNLEVIMQSEVKVLVTQSRLTLCNSMDSNPPGSFVHGISQARILEWIVIPSPGDLPNPGVKLKSPALQADSLLSEPPGKPSVK